MILKFSQFITYIIINLSDKSQKSLTLNKSKNISETKKLFNYYFKTFNKSYTFAKAMKQLILRHKQVLLFIIAGGLSAIVEIGTFKILSVYLPKVFNWEYNLSGIKYPFSNILSTSCGIITNYFLSIWFVFERGKHSKRREFAYFISVSVVSTFISLFLFQILYHFVFRDAIDLRVYVLSQEMMSKIASILIVSLLNYSIKKKVIFNG